MGAERLDWVTKTRYKNANRSKTKIIKKHQQMYPIGNKEVKLKE